MPEIVAAFAGWEPPHGAVSQSTEEQIVAARAMGGAVLPSSHLPEFIRADLAARRQAANPNPDISA